MSSIKSLLKPRARGSSDQQVSEDFHYDLLTQLTYMSAIAASGAGREMLFRYASELPLASSWYFRRIYLYVHTMNCDYTEACRLVAMTVKQEEVRQLLLRLSGALGSGEQEADFLRREVEVWGETFQNRYERDLESLKKWADAYAALTVSATIVVVVTAVSMMVYSLGSWLAFMLTSFAVGVTVLGSWVLNRGAPKDVITIPNLWSSGSRRARRSIVLLFVTLAFAATTFLWPTLGAGWAMLGAALFLLPVGVMAYREDRGISRKDSDVAAMLRAIGAVSSAIRTTIAEALDRMDLRSMGALAPEARRLSARLHNGLNPSHCWQRLGQETGSDLIRRSIIIFWDGIRLGGEPEQVGSAASSFSMRLALLRAKRRLVANSFIMLLYPQHLTLTLLLAFITETMKTFGGVLTRMQQDVPSGTPGAAAATGLSFASMDSSFLSWVSLIVILALTLSDAFAAHSSEGGHPAKYLFYLAGMLLLSGISLVVAPRVVGSLLSGFGSPSN